MPRRSLHFALALCAVVGGCSPTPYQARVGPGSPCNTSAEPLGPDSRFGICRWQMDAYRADMERLGYGFRDEQVSGAGDARTIDQWVRMRGDTSDVIAVEFAIAWEGSLEFYGGGVPVLRVNVSGQSFVSSDGKPKRVRDSASLHADVDGVAERLRDMFLRAQQRR